MGRIKMMQMIGDLTHKFMRHTIDFREDEGIQKSLEQKIDTAEETDDKKTDLDADDDTEYWDTKGHAVWSVELIITIAIVGCCCIIILIRYLVGKMRQQESGSGSGWSTDTSSSSSSDDQAMLKKKANRMKGRRKSPAEQAKHSSHKSKAHTKRNGKKEKPKTKKKSNKTGHRSKRKPK